MIVTTSQGVKVSLIQYINNIKQLLIICQNKIIHYHSSYIFIMISQPAMICKTQVFFDEWEVIFNKWCHFAMQSYLTSKPVIYVNSWNIWLLKYTSAQFPYIFYLHQTLSFVTSSQIELISTLTHIFKLFSSSLQYNTEYCITLALGYLVAVWQVCLEIVWHRWWTPDRTASRLGSCRAPGISAVQHHRPSSPAVPGSSLPSFYRWTVKSKYSNQMIGVSR